MQCTSCGTTLSPGTAICPKCGTHLSYTSDSDEITYVDYGSTETTAPASQAQTSHTPEPEQEHFNAHRPQESSSPDDGLQPAPVLPATQRPRRFSVITVLLLVVLVILIVIGGSGLVYFATVIHPREMNVQATTVTGTVLTRQALSTVTADAQANATAGALTPQEIYAKATSGTPVISDPLTSSNGSIWYHYDGSNGSCTFLKGAFHIKVFVKASNNACFASNSLFNNLAFQAQMTIIKGDAGGLLFHIGQGFYLFLVNRDGSYSLYLDIGIFAVLTTGNSSVINKGLNRSNLLTVVAFDGDIYLYVNKHPVAHTFDSTFSSGQLALFGESATDLTDVAFNNAQVWSI
jgi:hypothetical protein